MQKKRLEDDLQQAVKELGFDVTDIVCNIPQNSGFGDYTSNAALQLAKQKPAKDSQSAIEIANEIVKKIQDKDYLVKVEVAGPGFINFYLTDQALLENLSITPLEKQLEQTNNHPATRYLVEYAQPNTHKAFHIGHLRNITIGESIARLLEFQGDTVYRATYGSDIGLPVAKALWGVLKLGQEYEEVKTADLKERAEFLGRAYALGATTYEQDEAVKSEIDEINKKIYQKDPTFFNLWQETRQWSLDYFQTIYQRLGTKFDGVFCESEVEREGKAVVEEHIGDVFRKEQGAIIFPGEEYGLHTRVFITSAGHPTYEAKEIGLTLLEMEKSGADISLHVVGNEQLEYFKVVIKALEILYPNLKGRKKHLPYGFVNLKSGKMSSRTGSVVTSDWLLEQVSSKLKNIMTDRSLEEYDQVLEQVSVGAVKFGILRFAPATNMFFDLDSSVSLQGDSGPYVQYTYARISSVLAKSNQEAGKGLDIEAAQTKDNGEVLNPEERKLLRQLEYFKTIIKQATWEFKPNIICDYLLSLSRDFNLFYQTHKVIGSEREEFRLALINTVGETIKRGLGLLGIEAPVRM